MTEEEGDRLFLELINARLKVALKWKIKHELINDPSFDGEITEELVNKLAGEEMSKWPKD